MTHFHRLRQNRRQLKREAADNVRYVLLGLLAYAIITALAAWGHSAVSTAYGMDMPILLQDTFIPMVSK